MEYALWAQHLSSQTVPCPTASPHFLGSPSAFGPLAPRSWPTGLLSPAPTQRSSTLSTAGRGLDTGSERSSSVTCAQERLQDTNGVAIFPWTGDATAHLTGNQARWNFLLFLYSNTLDGMGRRY